MVIACALTAAGSMPASASTATVYNGKWAGYAATGGTFRWVAATFAVPAITCPATGDHTVYQWAGLDGLGDSTVEQSGIAEWCPGGKPWYDAWTDMYPARETFLFYVKPGDVVHVSTYYDRAARAFRMTVADATSGLRRTVTRACAGTCARSSAEVISEGYIGYEPHFGSVAFHGVRVTDDAVHRGTMLSPAWQAARCVQGRPGSVAAAPGPLSPDGSAFTVRQLTAWG